MALIKCPECGQEISEKAKKCIHCGKILKEDKEKKEYCRECGKEIDAKSTECPFCGCPVEQKSLKIGKGKIVIAGVVIIAALSVMGMYALKSSSPVKKYLSLVEKGEKTEAQEVFITKIQEDESLVNELTALRESEINKIRDDYVDGNLSYEDANAALEKYEEEDVSKKYFIVAKNNIQALNMSRNAFDEATDAENKGDIRIAIKKYKAVIPSDSNYDLAKSKIEQLEEGYLKNEIDAAATLAEQKEYRMAAQKIRDLIDSTGATDELKALEDEYERLDKEKYVKIYVADKSITPKNSSNWIFYNYINFVFEITNNSSNPIQGIEGTLKVNDLFDKEIIEVNCDFTGHIIQPNETYVERSMNFECNDFVDTHMKFFNTDYKDLKFEYKISSIVYADGTVVKP